MPSPAATRVSTLTGRRRKRAGRARACQGRACPHCGASLPGDLQSGPQRCPACGRAFLAAVFEPPTDPGPSVLPSGAGTPCAKHARNLAESSCQRCGGFMCSLCAITTDGRQHCADCFNRLAAEGALPSAVQRLQNHNAFAGLIGFLGIPFWIAGVVLGPIAILYGVRGMRQDRRLGESISSAVGRIGMVLGALECCGSAWFLLYLLARHR